MSPHWLMALGFLAVILIGTALLALPWSSVSGQPLPLLTSLFTATSATCVTGLSVIDIGSELTRFGQTVILFLIQIGGLGITTFSTFLLVLVGRRLSVQNEFVLMNAYGVEEVKGLRSLVLWTIGFTFLFEGLGTFLLWERYTRMPILPGLPSGPWECLYYAGFHAVSAFCNAGFSLHRDSLIPFQSDPLYLSIVDILIVAGGLGFLALYNVITNKFWRRNRMTRGRVSLHTKTVLAATLILIVVGAILFFSQEWDNTLKHLSLSDKITCSLFQSITPRTAGFNVIPMDQIKDLTRYVTALLMIIGGSPGSSAGGIKTTTLVVLVMTIAAMCRGRRETLLFSRTVPYTVVREALVIFLLAISVVLVAYGLLLWTEYPQRPDDSMKLFFETISATATVGLSINHTPTLSEAGRWVIIVCMFVGRLGPLAIALLIGAREDSQRIRYPQEELVVG